MKVDALDVPQKKHTSYTLFAPLSQKRKPRNSKMNLGNRSEKVDLWIRTRSAWEIAEQHARQKTL